MLMIAPRRHWQLQKPRKQFTYKKTIRWWDDGPSITPTIIEKELLRLEPLQLLGSVFVSLFWADRLMFCTSASLRVSVSHWRLVWLVLSVSWSQSLPSAQMKSQLTKRFQTLPREGWMWLSQSAAENIPTTTSWSSIGTSASWFYLRWRVKMTAFGCLVEYLC